MTDPIATTARLLEDLRSANALVQVVTPFSTLRMALSPEAQLRVAKRTAELLQEIADEAVSPWQPMDTMPSDGHVLVCWQDVDSGYDILNRREYCSIISYGEPPALGWMPLPARPAR
jgi:hypothetical protein